MTERARERKGRLFKLLGSILAGVLLVGGLGAVCVPKLVLHWLGGDQLRQLASRQLSLIFKTEGELQPLTWSYFSVSSDGFTSRPEAPGPWFWDIQSIRAEISPRLLLDRILRFSRISVGRIQLRTVSSPNAGILSAPTEKPDAPSGGSSDLFREIQIKKIEIKSLNVQPSKGTGDWGISDMFLELRPGRSETDFVVRGGGLSHPYPWLGHLEIQNARGTYAPPKIAITALEAISSLGGGISIQGDFVPGVASETRGKGQWSGWTIPAELSSLGVAKIQGKIQGNFDLEQVSSSGISGRGQVELVDAIFRVDPTVRTSLQKMQSANDLLRWVTTRSIGLKTSTFDILSGLADDPRWEKARLSSARANFRVSPAGWTFENLHLESKGFLLVSGQIQARSAALSGRILIGIDPVLGRKLNEFTYGQCFRRMEFGYLIEPVELSGTLQQPINDLAPKIEAAAQRRVAEQTARTVGAVLQKISGDQPGNTPAGTAGQILNSLFGPSQGR